MALDIESSLEDAVNSAESNYSYYLTSAQNFALTYLGGSIVKPDASVFPDAPSNTNSSIGLLETQLYNPDDLLSSGWPTYEPPEPLEWETLWSESSPRSERVWVSPEMDALSSKLSSLIQGGDTAWFTTQYQNRIFNEDRDRRLQALDDSLRMIAAKHAARGHRLPSSALTAQENELYQKFQFDSTSRSGEIMKMLEESARSFMQFGMEKGLTYEQINMEFTKAYNQALLEPIKLQYDAYLKQIESEVRSFEAEIRGVIARFDAEKSSWELTGVYNNVLVEKDIYPWKKYQVQVDAIAKEYEQKARTYAVQVQYQTTALMQTLTQMVNTLKIGSVTDINLRKGSLS